MVFQSNLYCKTVIRFSPSFRKNIQHFHLISLPDLTLHTETNDDHLAFIYYGLGGGGGGGLEEN